jgi:hypothetical protein
MVANRTEAEWRELYRQLRHLANDPNESDDRRRRALQIIATIPKQYTIPVPNLLVETDFDMEYGGLIV